ncbi:hypothetical protein [Achromobacter deleyi]|uniref:hypothetical protein n=1 Tax=Achromobacter deleyi TaxID=1353891 RepID=UPI001490C2FD|nr:hypothetical protein [Achromobacter deleyi]QVQ28404.1 hypothetical protein HLG70_08345 [Achromobacter deleyi]UIP23940.1 hypothetical protein LYZ39_15915 [Achromobacter deleyi]
MQKPQVHQHRAIRFKANAVSALATLAAHPTNAVSPHGTTATATATAAAAARSAAQAIGAPDHKWRCIRHHDGNLAVAAISARLAGRAPQAGSTTSSNNVQTPHFGGHEYRHAGNDKRRPARANTRQPPAKIIINRSHSTTLHRFSRMDACSSTPCI